MATKTWVGGTTTWATTTNWTPTGAPVSGDDVVFDNTKNCVINTTALLRSFVASSYTGIFSGSTTLKIVGSADVTSDFNWSSKSHTYSGDILFQPVSSGTVINATWGASTLACNVTVSGLGTVVFLTGLKSANGKTLSLITGTLRTDGATNDLALSHTIGTISIPYYAPRVFVGGLSTFNCGYWSMPDTTYLSTSASSVIINCSTTFYGTSNGYVPVIGTINFVGPTPTIRDGFNTGTLSVSGNATTSSSFTIYTSTKTQKIRNLLSIDGHSTIKRILISSAPSITVPSTLTVSGATVSVSGCDFRDIYFNNGGNNLDMPVCTGDLGGNGMVGGGTLTFTPSSVQTYTCAGDDKWSTLTNWAEHVPLPQDTAEIAGTASPFTINLDTPILGKNLRFTSLGSPTASATVNTTLYGSIDLTNCASFTGSSLTMISRGGTKSIKCGGKFFNNTLYFYSYTTDRTTWLLEDDFISTSSLNFMVGTSTFDASAYNVNVQFQKFISSYSVDTTAKLGDGDWVVTGSGLVWDSYNCPIYPGNSNLYFTNTSSSITRIDVYNSTFNNIYFRSSSSGGIQFTTITSPIANLRIDPNYLGPANVYVTSPYTLTLTDMSSGFCNGTNIITFKSSSNGAHAHVEKIGTGIIPFDYINIRDMIANTNATFSIGENSTIGTKVVGFMVPAKGMAWSE